MKRFVFSIVGWMIALHLQAEHAKAFQMVSIKTDLLHPYNIGLELPYGLRGSLDINIRNYSEYAFGNINRTDFRVFYKKHFERSLKGDNFQSTYFLTGLHFASWYMTNYPKPDWSMEKAELKVGCLALGFGKRFKMLDLWASTDFMLLPIVNKYRYINMYGQTLTNKAWKFPIMFFVGCSFNFVNFNIDFNINKPK